MIRMKILAVSLLVTLYVCSVATAHIIEGKWVDDGPDVKSGYAFGDGLKAYIYRDSLMHTMRTQHNLMRDITDGKVPMDKELFLNASRAFSSLVTMIPHAFGPKVIIPGSRVKPGIWEHWDMFVSLAEHFRRQAEEVTRIATEKGVEAAKPLVDAIDCGYCHRPFRIQDHELEIADITAVIKQQTTEGGKLYYSMGCVGCHGEGRERLERMNMFPQLAGQTQDYLATQLKAFRSNLRPGIIMPAVAKSLTDDQIIALTDYLSKL